MPVEILTAISFRPISMSDINIENLREIGRMHMEYARYSKDSSIDVGQLFDAIKEFIANPLLPFQFWLLLDGAKIVGFALTQMIGAPKGIELDISQAYISPGYRVHETQALAVQEFEKYALSRNCVKLTSSTKREPAAAYIRWMGRVGFRKRSVVMEKDLRRIN